MPFTYNIYFDSVARRAWVKLQVADALRMDLCFKPNCLICAKERP